MIANPIEAPEAYVPEKHTSFDFAKALRARVKGGMYPFTVQTDGRIWVVANEKEWQQVKAQLGVAIAEAISQKKCLAVRNVARGFRQEIKPQNLL